MRGAKGFDVDAAYQWKRGRRRTGQHAEIQCVIETDDSVWIECAMEYQPAQQALRVITFC